MKAWIMGHQKRATIAGFTLVELAIVLGVAGVLFGGLWRILSTSNVQMRDQAAANQQLQLIGAISIYLQSDNGQKLMANIDPNNTAGHKNPDTLILPATSGTGCTDTNDSNGYAETGLCALLPPGFTSTTANAYGQKYSIGLLKDSTPLTKPPQTYSFMILTTGGDPIPDSSGGRISAMIGGDGGFVYSQNVCNATNLDYACGSYGTWNVDIKNTYGLTYPTNSGVIASRTYYSPMQSINGVWLARTNIDGSGQYNTMQTTLYMNGNTINLGTSGQILGGNPSLLPMAPVPVLNLNETMDYSTNTPIVFASSCHAQSFSDIGSNTANGCNYVAQVNGSVNIADLLYSNQLYANQFIYQGSDVRLKKNIRTLVDPLTQVMKINPVSFAYKSNGRESMGVIAQELEKVYPQLVEQGPNDIKGVSYEGLIAPLIGAVQELKRENDSLREHQKEMQEELSKLRH